MRRTYSGWCMTSSQANRSTRQPAPGVDEVGLNGEIAVADGQLRNEIQAAHVERDSMKRRLDRVGRTLAGRGSHPPRRWGAGPADPSRKLDQCTRRHGALAEGGVGNRKRLVERKRPQAVAERPLDRRDAAGDVLGSE